MWCRLRRSLAFVGAEDYLKGAGNRVSGTDRLAEGAPSASLGVKDGDGLTPHYDGLAAADVNAQTAEVALVKVQLWHFRHVIVTSVHCHVKRRRSRLSVTYVSRGSRHHVFERFAVGYPDSVAFHADGAVGFE